MYKRQGVNWKVKILTVGVFSYIPSWDDTGAYDSDTMEGLNYIAGLKRSGVNIVAANMSLGGARELQSDNSAYGQAIKAASKAGEKGILICMAAGNDGYDLDELTDCLLYTSSYALIESHQSGRDGGSDMNKDKYDFVGESFCINDAAAKATGAMKFASDMNLYRELHLKLILSGVGHALIKNIEMCIRDSICSAAW